MKIKCSVKVCIQIYGSIYKYIAFYQAKTNKNLVYILEIVAEVLKTKSEQ